MISAYVVVPLVFGIVLSYLWLIHRFWLRGVFSENRKPTVATKIAGNVSDFSDSNLGRRGKMINSAVAA
jgi:hypothetical protein